MDKQLFKSVVASAAKNGVRYSLKGVALDLRDYSHDGPLTLIGTDGCRLHMIEGLKPGDAYKDTLEALAELETPNPRIVTLTTDFVKTLTAGSAGAIEPALFALAVKRVNQTGGRFPDYRRVIPAERAEHSSTPYAHMLFDPALLSQALAEAAKLGKLWRKGNDLMPPVELTLPESNTASLTVSISDGADLRFTAVVMPRRR